MAVPHLRKAAGLSGCCPDQDADSALRSVRRTKKWGPCLGTRAPSDAFPFVSVVFTPTRGVIHPSFPLRGRWERTLKSGEQAPSPSLITLLDSSSETCQHQGVLHELRQHNPFSGKSK